MNIQSIVGKKLDQTQGFLEDGRRVPLSVISVAGSVVSQVKTVDHEGYNSVQIGFGNNTKPNKPETGHFKKAGLSEAPRFFREIRLEDAPDAEAGQAVNVVEILEAGDLVDVTGTSKGKGFAGVVKKYHFRGGPKTHGQSDRHRARGSSGSGTTPGRVFKGKKMAGRMGDAQSTVKNLEILEVAEDKILLRGLIPGSKGSIVVIKKVGKNKKFIPLWSEKAEEEATAASESEAVSTDEVVTVEETVTTPEETVVTASDTVETPAVEAASDTVEIPNEENVSASESEAVSEIASEPEAPRNDNEEGVAENA